MSSEEQMFPGVPLSGVPYIGNMPDLGAAIDKLAETEPCAAGREILRENDPDNPDWNVPCERTPTELLMLTHDDECGETHPLLMCRHHIAQLPVELRGVFGTAPESLN